MFLKFRPTQSMLKHNGPYGLIKDNEVKDYPDNEAQRLLASFPNNFSAAKGSDIPGQSDPEEIEIKNESDESAIEKAETKPIDEEKQKRQRKK